MRYLFENYAFDTNRRELHRGADPVNITPQVFDLLDYLIRNREHVVSKDDLIDAIWGGRIVSDAALTTRLNAARSAIGDSGEEQRLIKTLPRKGFRFVGSVQEVQEPAHAATAAGPKELPKPALTLPDKPSIAVLPFANLSSDPEQEYFADGMVEDIITGLSRSKSLFVIARTSSFTFKSKAIDVKRIGRELGVRYVLEGSVRKAGNRVRITGQLIDAETGNHIWADRYDSTLEDIFDLQDRVTASVIGAISPRLEWAEIARSQRKPTESLQAYDYYLRALASNYGFTREANAEALRLSQIANKLDPDFALAYALGAQMLGQKKGFGWRVDAAAEIGEARRLARRALELDKTDATVLAGAGHALCFVVREVEDGANLLSRAINLDPNLAFARPWSGWAQVYLGDEDAAMEQFHVALRLSPLDPRIFLSQTGVAYAHFLAGRYEDASSWATAAIRQQSNFLVPHRILMASHVLVGRITEAREVCAGALLIDPSQRISKTKNRKFVEALRIAGMPE